MSAVDTSQTVATNLKAHEQMERTLSFISNEAKQAVKVETDLSKLPSEFTKPNTAEIALILQMPNDAAAAPIIYYVDNPKSDSPLPGPKLIYRWGPELNNGGYYTNGNQPANWSYKPLVAEISDETLSVDCGNWTAVPSNTTTVGAYSCVDSSQKIAKILVNREIDPNSANNSTLASSTTVFARSREPVKISNSHFNEPVVKDASPVTESLLLPSPED